MWAPACEHKLYHFGIRGNIARNTLANANATRDWRTHCDFGNAATQIEQGVELDAALVDRNGEQETMVVESSA